MAYDKIIVIRSRLDRCLCYAQNEEKTDLTDALRYIENPAKARLQTAINCGLETAFQEMQATKRRWGKCGGILGYSDDRPQSRPDDCWRNRPRADQFANWSGLDNGQPSEVRQTREANRRSPLARTSRCWEERRKPGIASHRETYLMCVLAYLQEYDIILSEP